MEIDFQQVALVWGDNDVLVEAEDLARIKDEVPNIVMNFKASHRLIHIIFQEERSIGMYSHSLIINPSLGNIRKYIRMAHSTGNYY